jgi:DNA-binding response OmpR family regulator
MLDLAKLEDGKLKPNPIQGNIIAWLQYVVESHKSMAEAKEVQLTFYAENPHLEMDYDPDQLSKVISNLLTNAIKFTERHGKVIFHVRHDDVNNMLCIKVRDSGIGIPEKERERIFDRFYQVASNNRSIHSGTGIGLALSKEIVEVFKGTIRVTSDSGKGSEFEVRLPVTHHAPVVKEQTHSFNKALLLTDEYPREINDSEWTTADDDESAWILVAEDNRDVAGYILDTIRPNYKVKWAADGEKAIEMATERIPDLVITDVMMPGKNGFEVCNILKTDERTDHIPVIMLTAKATDVDRISGYEQGADAYLTKPFSKKELMVRIRQLLKLRKQLQAKYSKLELVSPHNEQPLTPEDQFVAKATRIVESNIHKSMFNASDLAMEVHLGESQLYRKLKAITGKSTALFIRSVRLRKAKELLGTTSLSVSEIAYQVGFNDPAWFSRVFKEEYGASPSELRKN